MKAVIGLVAALALVACGSPESDSIEIYILHASQGATLSGSEEVLVEVQVLGTYNKNGLDQSESFRVEARSDQDWVSCAIDPVVVNRGRGQLRLKSAPGARDGAEAKVQICASTVSAHTTTCSFLAVRFHSIP
jgi:uncharacterized lipoprotein YmbA